MSERDKFLTEAIDGKVRNVTPEKREFRGVGHIMFMDFVCSCCDGPQSACNNYATDFSTWPGFGKLWEWSHGQEWWGVFFMYGVGKPGDGTIYVQTGVINPDRFANAVFEFLKGRES